MPTELANYSHDLPESGCTFESPAEYNEERAVADAKAGSTTAFDKLVERYRARVLRVAQSIARSHEDAEEIAQSAFVQAFKYLSNFRGESRFYTWLVRITINEGLMRARRRHLNEFSIDEFVETEQGGFPRELQDSGLTPEELVSQLELNAVLRKNISRLSPIYRTVVELHDVHGYSTREIAKALTVSSAAVKTRLLRARTTLRNSIAKSLGSTATRRNLKRATAPFRPCLADLPIYRRRERARAA
jgi:RNA polymerase sigma-70 factor, ECF subfamily